MRTVVSKRGWARLLCAAAAVAISAVPAVSALAEDAPLFKLNVGGLENQAGSGAIKGVVKFEGKQATRKRISGADNDAYCASQHKDKPLLEEFYVFGDNNTLQDVFVYVSKGTEGKTFAAPSNKPELDQIGCQYVPHVQGVVKGQDLLIKNSDGANHNVNAQPTANARFNMASPPKSEENKKFSKAEMAVPFRCDVHPWMNAYVHVMDHPFFAVTQQDGTFEIRGLPPGDYEVSVWHGFDRFAPDKPSQPVTVKAGETAELTFTYAPKAKPAAQ